ncbi:WD repeat-containing protein 81 isoform X2 [Halyomorpha halys]|uniref:WD repeat-containing protein 81 isoform X2 n=1 Tax=Halyomorpha halys TaxID=286706 RepID=UPI0006D4DEAF|nr:WD repeat-containing protein 81 isoform X2 [Halyomorpha halys]
MEELGVHDELNIPKKYIKLSTREDRIEAIVNKNWLKQLFRSRKVPDFVLHDKLSDDEISALFKQGEHFSSEWQKILVSVIKKKESLVIPLPRVRPGGKPSTKLSLSQILQYVSHTNYKNLWKEAYRKYNSLMVRKEEGVDNSVQLMEHSALLREIISRAYGAPIVKEGHIVHDVAYRPHSNIFKASIVVETNKNFFIIHESHCHYTVLDCVTFSPAVLSGTYSKPLFILYQLLRLMRHLHDLGLVLGSITLADVYITEDLWIQVLPRLEDNVHNSPTDLESQLSEEKASDKNEVSADLYRLTEAWVVGALSNYDYLCELNRLAGRRYGDPRSHYVLPWVTDFSSRSGANWRDLTKSKFRLNKGDRQLDLTYELPPTANVAQIRHHVPDVLSEITYYVYLSRITPKSILCKYVRPQWVPGEYPASIQRLQSWTPDECIPEFFTDPSVFKSIHSDLCDLEVPSWCSSPQDFIISHRAALESQAVSEKLHHWIDLTFGFKLTGPAAVKAKNICLQLVDGHKVLSGSGVVQLFANPHPHRSRPSLYLRKTPPKIHQPRRKCNGEEEEGQSSGLEEEEQMSSALLFSRFISRSRASLSSPSNTTASDAEKTNIISLPKDYNPVEAILNVESLHSFMGRSSIPCFNKDQKVIGEQSVSKHSERCRQVLANTRATEMQSLGCFLVELFLPHRVRVFGNGLKSISHEERLQIARYILSGPEPLPKCIAPLVKLLTEDKDTEVTQVGSPPPSAHQLLQPLLAPVHFPRQFSLLYSTLESLRSYSTALADLSAEDDLLLLYKIAEVKVKSLSTKIEELVESEVCLGILMPYVIEMLSSPLTDVLAAWYLFDHIARALGPKRCRRELLEVIVQLYDWEKPRERKLLQKRVKLYHRSFLVTLIVRFGLSTFLDVFVPLIAEAVGGYHDLDENIHTHLSCCDVEEGVEADSCMPLSPLDEDSSVESEKNNQNTISKEVKSEPETVNLEEDSLEETPKMGPKSAVSLQNLLIDNPEEEKEGDEIMFNYENSWKRKSFANMKPLHVEQEVPDVEYSKVCEVSTDSLAWLAPRLGPVLTSVYIGRSLLRLLGLAYTGAAQLVSSDYSLTGDSTTTHLLRSLASITGVFGDQVIVCQYLPHITDLVALCKRKLTPSLEGALIGSLSLLSYTIPFFTESTFNDILQDGIIKGVVDPCLRLVGSRSLLFPSGVNGRRGFGLKILSLLISLSSHACPQQRLILLQTLQKFFLVLSKANCDRKTDIDLDCETKSIEKDGCCNKTASSAIETSIKVEAQQELKEALGPQFAYLSYTPFADFFGENVMEQTLKNHELIKHLCSSYYKESSYVSKRCEIEPRSIPEESPLTPVGSFGNVIIIGNRIEIQEAQSKSASPAGDELSSKNTKKSENTSRHLHGNWLAYWEHELGRNQKNSGLNIKQIKLQAFAGHTNTVKHIIPLGSENSFMSASRDKTVRLWSLRSQGDGSHVSHAQWTYSEHRKSVLSLAWVERTRLTASSDSVLHLWDPFVGRQVSVIDGTRGVVNTIKACRESSPEVLCATTDPTLRSLDTRVGAYVRELKISQSGGSLVRCMVLSPESKWVAVGQATGQLTVIDMTMGSIISSWKAHEAEVLQLVAVDEHILVSSALDQAVSLWNVNDGKLLYNLKGTTEPVHCLELFGNELVWGTTANRIGVHSGIEPSASYSSTKLRTDSLKGVLTSLALLPLTRLLLLGADSGAISLLC